MWRLFVALMAFAAGNSALAVPAKGQATKADDDCSEKDVAAQLIDYQSTVFGWQVAGSATNDDMVTGICDDISGIGSVFGSNYSIWGEEGLALDMIKSAVCRDSRPNTSTALPKIRNITSSIYTTLINGSFDMADNTVSSYLCNNLDHALIAAFNISDNTIIDTVCTAAGSAPLPAPVEGPSPNDNAINAFITAASELYAIQYASSATSDSSLTQYCAHFQNAKSLIDDLDLNGETVHNWICGLDEPPCYEEAKEVIMEWNSKMFAILIENASNAQGYQKWLCQNLKMDLMDGLGLNGTLVSQSVCSSDSE